MSRFQFVPYSILNPETGNTLIVPGKLALLFDGNDIGTMLTDNEHRTVFYPAPHVSTALGGTVEVPDYVVLLAEIVEKLDPEPESEPEDDEISDEARGGAMVCVRFYLDTIDPEIAAHTVRRIVDYGIDDMDDESVVLEVRMQDAEGITIETDDSIR